MKLENKQATDTKYKLRRNSDETSLTRALLTPLFVITLFYVYAFQYHGQLFLPLHPKS